MPEWRWELNTENVAESFRRISRKQRKIEAGKPLYLLRYE
jgi:hypothetical protein